MNDEAWRDLFTEDEAEALAYGLYEVLPKDADAVFERLAEVQQTLIRYEMALTTISGLDERADDDNLHGSLVARVALNQNPEIIGHRLVLGGSSMKGWQPINPPLEGHSYDGVTFYEGSPPDPEDSPSPEGTT